MRIVNRDGAYDIFRSKCPRCGVEFEYSRRSIRPHRRWPNGFVYCPKCKMPIGHDNSCFIYNRLENQPKQTQVVRSQEELDLRAQLRALKACQILFLIFGIFFMVFGTALMIILKDNPWMLVGVFLVLSGIAMIVVRAAVFSRIRARKLIELEKIARY